MTARSPGPEPSDHAAAEDTVPVVGVVMGSDSDLDVMEPAAQVLSELDRDADERVRTR